MSAAWRAPDLVALGDHGLEGRGGRQRGRDVLEAGGALVDPVVAGERVAPAGALADQQHADPGRPAPLVGRGGGRRPAVGEREAAGGGAGVDEERYVGQRRDHVGERLHGADLVVGGLHRGDGDAGGGRGAGQRLDVDPAEPVDRDDHALPAGPGRGVQHGRVLDGGVDHRGADPGTAGAQPEQPAVDGVGAGRRERHLVGAHVQAGGDRLAGVVEQDPCRPAGSVQPAGIGVPLVERGQQDLAGGGVQRLRRRGVEVDRGDRRRAGPGDARGPTGGFCHTPNLVHATPAGTGATHPVVRGSIPIMCARYP